MNHIDVERAEAAAVQALGALDDARHAFTEHGEDPRRFARMLARIVVESDAALSDEIPLDQSLRAAVAAERLRAEGLRLDHLLELSMAVAAAVARELRHDRISGLGRALVLVLTRAYLDAQVAEHQEQKQELRALIGISRAVNRTLDPYQVAEAGLRETLRAMGLDAGGIWLNEGNGGGLALVHSVGVSPEVQDRLQSVDLESSEEVMAVLSGRAAAQFGVVAQDPLRGAYGSTVVVPLRTAHGEVGLLAVGSRRERTFDESEVGFAAAVADHLAAALDHAFEHRREAHTDYLTGLANRSEFETAVRRELAAMQRHHRPLSLVLMDLDQLKRINDQSGHHAGDEAIRTVAQVIRKAVRTSDLSARLGGDEFGIAMPDTGLEQAGEVVARIEDALRGRTAGADAPIALELSFGATESQPGLEYRELFDVADRLLYREKRRHQARRARRAARDGRLRESKASFPLTSSRATR